MATETFTLEQAEDHISDLRGMVDRLTEIVSMGNATDTPVTPTSGAALYTTGGQPAYVNQQGLQMNLSGGISDVGVQTVTAASLQALSATFTVPANDMALGSAYALTCFGNGTWGSTQQTLTFQPEIDGAAVGTNPGIDSTAFAASAAFRWYATFNVLCVTAGAGGNVQLSGMGCATQTAHTIIPGTALNNTVPFAYGTSSNSNLDTTASHTIVMKCQWASTTGTPTITCHGSLFTRLV